ncbi:MAG: gliding motility-associated C-terminal domain-containing protein [Sphingobacteriales bacterium]|nr:gliding motility-associated C-terminal domain-containing protein [Sphingobacteriales bacterium]
MKKILIIFLFGFQTAIAQVNLNQGLIFHHPFNGNANDISGNNINGTVVNATLTTDRNGNANSAYYFNGSNTYIELPFSNLYNFAPQDSFSISVWVLPDQGYAWPAQAVVVKAPPHPDFTLSQWNYGSYILNYKAMSGYAYNHILNGTTTLINNPCWYNIVTTYKNGIWKLYVNGVLESSDLSQTKFILQDGFSKIAFGKKGESFGDWYKGKMDEVRLYNRVLNQAEVDTIVGTCYTPCPQKNDFSISRNPCTPYEISLLSNSSAFNNIKWDFGDGNFALGSTNTTHTYSSAGNYLVTMITDYPYCSDTVKKTITVDIQNDNLLISTNDTTICFGTTKQLLTKPALNFCWTPTTFLNNPNSANPITSTPQNITYYYTAEVTGNNIITNGNFNAGNTGFTSQYTYANPNVTEGQYFVGTNPQAWNTSLSPCVDHTTGNGNMMLVNGSPIADVKVWTQSVTVTPNTNYAFSTWIQALWPPNPAQLQFSINGNAIGSLITASLPTCTWTQFYTTWNSGNSSSASISIVNKNTQVQGNDFALDDISFAPVFMKRDSVKITVDKPTVVTNSNTTVCQGTSVQLNTTGASTYSWSPVAGLNNPNIANPIATPVITTQYIVTGTTTNNCVAKDTVVITVNPAPAITKSNDSTICTNGSAQLFASGGVSYSWTPAATLNNPSIPNPIASPGSTTTYYVTVTGANTCTKLDSVKITFRPSATFAVNPPANICLNKSVQLNASGGHVYNWTPAATLNNAVIADPVASPASTTTYSVSISDTICRNTGNLSTTITVLPLPLVKASKSNDVDCSSIQSQLSASGAVTYSWSPSATLNNGSISNPIATPIVTTQYLVTGTDLSGCVNYDSVIVLVSVSGQGSFLMPTAFTPNKDGLNDCYGIKYWPQVLELEFSIYNRWGERVFYTNNAGDCWNGKYKGVPQTSAVFVYMIKAKTNCGEVFCKGTFALIK